VITTLVVREPKTLSDSDSEAREQRVIDWIAARAHWPPWMQNVGAWIVGAIVGPIANFFGRFGLGLGLLIFAFIGVYRLTDFAMGVMTNPFYIDIGFTLTEIAAVIKIFGLLSALAGVFIGGVVVAKFGRL